jgi:membrane-bound hydrogenase subunit beta
MNTDETLELAEKLVSEWTVERTAPGAGRLDFTLGQPDDLVPAVAALRVQRLGYLSAITGIDLGPEAGRMEVLYHFCTGEAVVTLRVGIPRQGGRVPSLCDLIPSAGPFERELREMFGVTVDGLPNPGKLYLSDDWPEGNFPLRKDSQAEVRVKAAEEGGS